MEPFSGLIVFIASQGLPWTVSVTLGIISYWLLRQLLKSKDSNIESLKELGDKFNATLEKNNETMTKVQTTLDVYLPLINSKRENGG